MAPEQATADKPFSQPFHGRLYTRRDARVRYRAPFRLLWDEHLGQPKYAKVFCNEVSDHGLSLETSRPIPVGARISLRAESGTLCGGACVKHVTGRTASYVVGVQFSEYLIDEALALVREAYSTPRGR